MPKTHKEKENMVKDFDKLFEDKNRKKIQRKEHLFKGL